MTLSLIISLIALGFVLVFLEIFLVPGFIVGVIGAISIAIGVGMIYENYGSFEGNITLLASVLSLAAIIFIAFRSGFWDKVSIKDTIDGKANNVHLIQIEVGAKGTTVSALRPAGSAEFNDQKLEVHAEGDFILANETIVVTRKVGNRIFVKKEK